MEIKEKTSVLIVGGGIVGLTAALLLQQHSVPSILVERHSGTSIHPRARGVNNRSMEIFRELDLEEEIRQAGKDLAPAMGILQGETLVAALRDFHAPTSRTAYTGMVANLGDVSPTSGTRVTQDRLEPVLLKAARQRGGDLRFYTELLSFEQDEQGITAMIVDRAGGNPTTIHTDYMLAADGANSFVRRQLAVTTSGRGVLGHQLNVLFKADLRELTHEREFSMCRIDNPAVSGLFTSIDFQDTWVFHIAYDPKTGTAFPPERCKQLIRVALGLADIEIEIKSILPWESAMRVMDTFQHGRIFFAGDAAHQMPPWGGQGANSGVADVHNLAWKLSAVLTGQAGPTLLQTYNAERHPVDFLAAEESAAAADEQGNMAIHNNLPAWQERFPRILGYYTYQQPSQAIIHEAREVPTTDLVGLDGRPGTRVPHAWLYKQGQHISTLDLAREQFTLLTGMKGEGWCQAARALAAHLPIKLEAYRVGPQGELVDAEGQWQQRAGIEATGALLLRPDGYIAWRAPQMTLDPIHDLETVFTQIFDRALA